MYEISDDRLHKALLYLASTDIDAAKARGRAEGLAEQRKSIKAMLMLESTEKTGPMKESSAYAHRRYLDHLELLENAIIDYETLKLKRQTESLIVEVWRSTQANKRAGNIT